MWSDWRTLQPRTSPQLTSAHFCSSQLTSLHLVSPEGGRWKRKLDLAIRDLSGNL
ncbi:hypothetical protein E2C01_068137 [Portunus trituberculatus]|uniref:Uncharacterized protein n=1 Tax=Portunus trituberculatus TaxID=210409 RepID=A0A5B7HN42_PORTR|nr:hypothetical protein [Portunus trituberculatus]